MEKVKWRELRDGAKIIERLPVVLEYDDVNVAVMLSLKQYNQLVKRYNDVKLTQAKQATQDDVKLPIYNPAVHPPGTHVRAWKGKRLVEAIVPDLDGDGHQIPW